VINLLDFHPLDDISEAKVRLSNWICSVCSRPETTEKTQENVSIPSNEERKQYMPIKDINNNLKVFSTVRENKKKKSFARRARRASGEPTFFWSFTTAKKEGKENFFMARAVFLML
jgi:hypothetical protein